MSIHLLSSPQVAGLSTRFRFGPPEDMLPQTSASHSDLGQLASQGGNKHPHTLTPSHKHPHTLTPSHTDRCITLTDYKSHPYLPYYYYICIGLGMYESPLFLAAHDEDGGGRSVPTTPLQVAAPG